MANAQQKAQDMFVRYSDGVETIQQGEAEISEQIAATLLDIAKKVGERQRHTVRAVHAKSHGLLKAEVTVLPDLREELRQGLFAKPASYGVVMRFSTDPGDILSDHISTPRGLAIKVVGVEGEMLPNHAGQVTQDFVFNNASTFAAHADDFLKAIRLRAKHVDDSEALKQAVSSAAQTAEETLELVGQKSAFLKGFGHPPTHPLGETYHTAAPLRFGDYFGKMRLAPVSDNLIALRGKHVDHPHSWNCCEGQHRGVLSKGNGSLGATRSALHRPHEDACRRRLRRMGRAPQPPSNGCPDYGSTSECVLGCSPGLG